MALSTAALIFSVIAGLLAVVPWPRLPWVHPDADTACPLGFGGNGDGEAALLPQWHSHRPAAASSSGGSSQPSQTGKPLQALPSLAVYTNAKVWTGDVAAPHAEAFAVDRATGRFLHVGSRADALAAANAAAAGKAAAAAAAAAGGEAATEGAAAGAAAAPSAVKVQVLDLQGATVIPGLIDSHLHLIPGGLSLSRLDFSVVSVKRQLMGMVAAAVTMLRPGQWLLGGGWDESRWGGEMPSAAWIDEITPDTPAWLIRHDAHMGLANTAAMRLAGIDSTTPDPAGGAIVRDADGQPTGLLTDAAMQMVADRIPPLSVAERRQALEAAVQHALSRGITMVHDMGRVEFMEGPEAAWQDLEEVYLPAANGGRLPLRVYAFVPLSTWRRMAERVKHVGTAHPSGMLFWGGVKEFADGSLGSRTALFHEPYADQPGTSGTRTIELDRLRQLVAAADGAGLQVAVHAIGDRAVDDVLQVYAELAANHSSGGNGPDGPGGNSDSGSDSDSSATGGVGGVEQGSSSNRQRQRQWRRPPHRIEHAQHISGPAAAQRMAAAGVAVTPNPLHLPTDRAVLEARLGVERAGAGRTYAFRTLLEAGVTSAFGSDWPVVPLEPLSGTLYAAVHRQAPPGGASSSHGGDEAAAAAAAQGPWAPEERLSVAQALAAHTHAGAAAAGLEADLGAVRAGLLADFVVLSGPPDSPQAAVLQTHVGGKCVYGCAADAGTAMSK